MVLAPISHELVPFIEVSTKSSAESAPAFENSIQILSLAVCEPFEQNGTGT